MSQAQCIRLNEDLDLHVDAFIPGLETHLFNAPAFFRLHSAEGTLGHYFQLASRREGLCACVHFTQVGPGSWRSPARGTFGGFSRAPQAGARELALLIGHAADRLAADGAREVSMVLPPSSHDPGLHDDSLAALATCGFRQACEDINQDMLVDQRPLAQRMSYGNLKRQRKCVREGIRFEALDAARHEAAYRLIADNRERRGHPLTMSWEAIATMRSLLPDTLLFFGACGGERMFAAAICVRISPGVLYVFYWGDAAGTQTLSPVVVLADGIYGYCQDHGIRLLDAGISTDRGQPNEGLLTFKRNLGFTTSAKLTMVKTLVPDA